MNRKQRIMMKRRALLFAVLGILMPIPALGDPPTAPEGFVSLFNGKDLAGWKVPDGDNGHWKVVDGVIDYDAGSEATGDKSLWSDREYGDFILQLDWRLKEAPFINKNVPYILPDGTHARDINGKELRMALPDADSGVFLARRRLLSGEHLVLADRVGRNVQRSHGSQDASRCSCRRHASHPGRQAGRPVEPFRDHRQRQDRQRGVERQNGHPRRPPSPLCPTAGGSPFSITAARTRMAPGPARPAWFSSRIFISKSCRRMPAWRGQTPTRCGPC